EGHSLILHRDLIDDLPLLLRVYVGSGLQMYGELGDEIDLIKIHITSGKLTLAAYDAFEKSVPFLTERIKIKMAEQDIDFFDYVNEQRRPPLLNKHLYIQTNDKKYKKQKNFDQRLALLMDYDSNEEAQMNRAEFEALLGKHNKHIKGFNLVTKKPS
ncbi:hypothetical protein AB4567_29690, partial [Vibrio sp. 10N.222.51.A6]